MACWLLFLKTHLLLKSIQIKLLTVLIFSSLFGPKSPKINWKEFGRILKNLHITRVSPSLHCERMKQVWPFLTPATPSLFFASSHCLLETFFFPQKHSFSSNSDWLIPSPLIPLFFCFNWITTQHTSNYYLFYIVQLNRLWHAHSVVQPSLLCNFKNFSSPQKEALCPSKQSLPTASCGRPLPAWRWS